MTLSAHGRAARPCCKAEGSRGPFPQTPTTIRTMLAQRTREIKACTKNSLAHEQRLHDPNVPSCNFIIKLRRYLKGI